MIWFCHTSQLLNVGFGVSVLVPVQTSTEMFAVDRKVRSFGAPVLV